MKHLISWISITFLSSCSTQPNKVDQKTENIETGNKTQVDSAKYLINKGTLTGETERLNVSYAAIMCPCPQWYKTKNADKEGNRKVHFYLEPDNSSLIQADTLFAGKFLPVRISMTGQFYAKHGYPKNYFPTKGDPKPARVFRYNKIEIIQRGQAFTKKNSL